MKPKEKKINFRIIVNPKSLHDYNFFKLPDDHFGKTQEQIEKEYLEKCRSIEDQILRHVDEVDSINIEYDIEKTCPYCNYTWDEESTCCLKREENEKI